MFATKMETMSWRSWKIETDYSNYNIFIIVIMFKNWIHNIVWVYLVWILIHYLVPHMYVHMCVPATAMGFIMSPLNATTPHCRAMRWAIYESGEIITTIWIVMGTWIAKRICLDDNDARYYVNPERKRQ